MSTYLRFWILIGSIAGCLYTLNAQEQGILSGNLEMNGNFFMRDSLIGADNTPQYDNQLFGADAWLQLNYSYQGFVAGVRFDMFNNSNLLNPLDSYSDQGIGRWYIKKKFNRLAIEGGYIYDQIGSGIIFRSFEQRPLLIDNALYGIKLEYDITPDLVVKAFSGRQKQLFDLYGSTIRGLSLDGFSQRGNEEKPTFFAPGFGVVARGFDDNTMNAVVEAVSTYTAQDRFKPQYNTYAFSVYNTLSHGGITWYFEGAYKTRDIYNDPLATRVLLNGQETQGKLVNKPGKVLYSSLSYAGGGLGIVGEVKRTESFTFRADPFVQLNRGMINFIPPMTRVNTFRLTSRYQAATQELGEMAVQVDAQYNLNKKWNVALNFSNITDLDNLLLYREIYTEAQYKPNRNWQFLGGIQRQQYNQELYEVKPGVPLLEAVTPYVEVLHKFSRKKALRVEMQYMNTDQDYGSWLFGLAEFSIVPHWTFTVSDMYNFDPKKKLNSGTLKPGEVEKPIHFPRVDVFYTYRTNRFSLSYVKQVEGVVCTGGICRLEPAFSGVKASVNATF
jgi:hypothetical protein